MALSTTQYGYIIDPMVPFTDDKGKTIKNGFVRVFVAGSSTPVVTYRNFDGATNQDRIELDNSGRTMTSVIGSKGLTYKVCVYDKHHSQESPILTVDKVSVIGANITAGAGSTLVTGLDGLATKPDGFVDASVVGTDGYVALDHTLVTDDLDTDAKVDAVENDRYIPLLNKDVNDPDSKMTLGRLWKWVLGKIKSLPTTITAFRTGDYIAVDGPDGTAKMSADIISFPVSESESNDITLYNGILGYYLGTDGTRHANDDYYYSDMFAVTEGDTVVWDSGTGSTTICLLMYDSGKNYVNYYTQSNTHPRTITIPSGVSYIRATFRNNNSTKELTINSDSKNILLSNLKSIVEDTVVTAEFASNESENNDIALYNGVIGYYLGTDGKRHLDSNYYYSDFFAVSENDTVVWDSGTGSNTICIILYDSSKKYVAYYTQSSTHPRTITIPSGVAFVRATFRNNNSTKELTINSNSKDILLHHLNAAIEDVAAVAEFASNESESNDITLYNGILGYYLGTDGTRHANDDYYYSDMFAVTEGDSVVWDSGTGSTTICIHLYDTNKKYVTYYTQSNTHPRTITIPSGVSYVRATFRRNNSAKELTIDGDPKDILLHYLKDLVIGSSKSVTNIRFATYNTGRFEGIGMSAGSSLVAAAMKEAISDACADIMYTQEDVEYFHATETSREKVFMMFKNYTRLGDSEYNYKAFASNYEIMNVTAHNYTGGTYSHKYFMTGDLYIKGVQIVLINVHLDWRDNTSRQNQLSQISAYASNFDNVIIAGDFNPENCINGVPQYNEDTYEGMDTSDTDLLILTSVGFKFANNGYWGKKNTFYSTEQKNYVWPCDNIGVKSEDGMITIKDIHIVHHDYMDDHFIVYSDISVTT